MQQQRSLSIGCWTNGPRQAITNWPIGTACIMICDRAPTMPGLSTLGVPSSWINRLMAVVRTMDKAAWSDRFSPFVSQETKQPLHRWLAWNACALKRMVWFVLCLPFRLQLLAMGLSILIAPVAVCVDSTHHIVSDTEATAATEIWVEMWVNVKVNKTNKVEQQRNRIIEN